MREFVQAFITVAAIVGVIALCWATNSLAWGCVLVLVAGIVVVHIRPRYDWSDSHRRCKRRHD